MTMRQIRAISRRNSDEVQNAEKRKLVHHSLKIEAAYKKGGFFSQAGQMEKLEKEG